MAVKHGYTATGTNDGTKQVSVTRWNDDHAIDMEGLVIPLHTSTPTSPSADNTKIFCEEIANRSMPAFIDSLGVEAPLQPHIGRSNIAWVRTTNSTNLTAFGITTSQTGTSTVANVGSTSLHNAMTRLDILVTTASTSAIAEFRTNHNGTFHRGSAAGRGGFHMVYRVAPATGGTVATRRFFCGMYSAGGGTPGTDVNPSTLLNIAGAGYDSGDTNWQLMFNDGAGAATKVDTGIARPSTDRPDPFEISVYCAPNGSTIYAEILRLVDGVRFLGSEGTNIPANSTMLAPRFYHSVGGTSSVVGITLFSLYVESSN